MILLICDTILDKHMNNNSITDYKNNKKNKKQDNNIQESLENTDNLPLEEDDEHKLQPKKNTKTMIGIVITFFTTTIFTTLGAILYKRCKKKNILLNTPEPKFTNNPLQPVINEQKIVNNKSVITKEIILFNNDKSREKNIHINSEPNLNTALDLLSLKKQYDIQKIFSNNTNIYLIMEYQNNCKQVHLWKIDAILSAKNLDIEKITLALLFTDQELKTQQTEDIINNILPTLPESTMKKDLITILKNPDTPQVTMMMKYYKLKNFDK